MTPKEKAEELVDKMFVNGTSEISYKIAKQCALIAVDEIMKCDPLSPSELTGKKTSVETYREWEFEALQYWQQVKTEIERL